MEQFPINKAGHIESLIGVKEGDKFIRKVQYGSRNVIVECTKITPKYADIGNGRYRIKDASPQGRGYDSPGYLSHYTPEVAQEIRANEKRLKQDDFLRRVNYNLLPYDLVNQVYGFIFNETQKLKGTSNV